MPYYRIYRTNKLTLFLPLAIMVSTAIRLFHWLGTPWCASLSSGIWGLTHPISSDWDCTSEPSIMEIHTHASRHSYSISPYSVPRPCWLNWSLWSHIHLSPKDTGGYSILKAAHSHLRWCSLSVFIASLSANSDHDLHEDGRLFNLASQELMKTVGKADRQCIFN
jgi:hypothetical protein